MAERLIKKEVSIDSKGNRSTSYTVEEYVSFREKIATFMIITIATMLMWYVLIEMAP